MAFHVVRADAQHFRPQLGQLLLAIAKRTCFLRAAGRVVFRIKIEHHGTPPQANSAGPSSPSSAASVKSGAFLPVLSHSVIKNLSQWKGEL